MILVKAEVEAKVDGKDYYLYEALVKAKVNT